MRSTVLLREITLSTLAARVPTGLVLVIVAAMVAATLATVGRTAAAEEAINSRINAAGSRLLEIHDTGRKDLIGAEIVAQADGFTTVERAVGVDLPVDVVNGVVGAGGNPVPAWGVAGRLAHVAELSAGRWPQEGEALVSTAAMRRLGWDEPFGWVRSTALGDFAEFAVVGSFTAREPFDAQASGILIQLGDTPTPQLSVVLADAAAAAATQPQVIGLIAPKSTDDLRVQSPVGLAELQAQVREDFGSFGRGLLVGVLGGGGALVAIVVLSDVLIRRADLGRRRALGASRGTVVALVLGRTLVPALFGCLLGALTGLVVVGRMGIAIPWTFTAGTVVLALLAAAASAVPPAAFAATRDPVRVLRTP